MSQAKLAGGMKHISNWQESYLNWQWELINTNLKQVNELLRQDSIVKLVYVFIIFKNI
jgi:hypothetical protein